MRRRRTVTPRWEASLVMVVERQSFLENEKEEDVFLPQTPHSDPLEIADLGKRR